MGAGVVSLTNDDRKFIAKTIEEAGKILAGYFCTTLERNVKGIAADYNTKADRESEAYIFGKLKKRFPNFSFLGEETGKQQSESEYEFILDPLDGTHTFGIGFPIFAISLALMKKNEVVFGIVHEPIPRMTYIATKGEGATRNGKRIHVNTTADLPHAVISYTQGWKVRERRAEALLHALQKALDPYERFIEMWSPSSELAHIASGHITASINYKNEVYDFAAGKLLIREAGGRITNLDGTIQKNDRDAIFVASNGTVLHDEILKRIRGIIPA
ncbi:MAG: inositol monophosphatase [Patescibacteria group bacterium]|jgi:myo-inositol-1(or 4)-monophosphatase